MFFPLLNLIALLGGVYFFGWQFSRRVLRQNERYLLIPLSASIGICAYIFVINILGYFVGIQLSFYATLVFLVLAAVLLKFKLDAGEIVQGISKKYFRLVVVSSLLLAALYIPIFFTSYSWDERWHGPLISTVTEGNFPITSPFVPGSKIFYHYGIDLWVSAVQFFTGLTPPLANAAAGSVILVFIFWLSFAVVHKITKNSLAAFLASFLLFFGGGIRYFLIPLNIDCGQCLYVWDYLKGIAHIFFSSPLDVQLDHFFHPYSVDTFGVYVYRRSALLALMSSLTILYLGYLVHKYSRRSAQIALVIVFGILALAEETYFVVLLASWILWQIIFFFQNKDKRKRIALTMALVLAGIFIVVSLQGGVISSLLQNKIVGNMNANNSSFSLRTIPGIISFGDFYPFTKARSWLFFLIEWGLPMIIFPFAWIFLRKKRNEYLSWLFLTVLVGLAVAFFINYDVQPREMSRVNAYAFWFINIITGIGLGFWYSRKKVSRWVIIVLLAVMMISPLTYSLRKWPVHRNLLPVLIEENSNLVLEAQIAEKAREIVPANEAVLTALPLAVTQLWGRVSYYGAPAGLDALQRNVPENLEKLILNNDLSGLLTEKNVRYIYSEPEINFIFSLNNISLVQAIDLEEAYKYDNEHILYRIR